MLDYHAKEPVARAQVARSHAQAEDGQAEGSAHISLSEMKTEPEMPLNVSELIQDTLGFSNAELGSYLLLIMDYWANARPLPNDDGFLQQVARCKDGEWVRTKGMLARKFNVSNGSWTHERVERAIAESKARKQAICRASAAGVEARRALGQIPPSVQSSVSPSVIPSVTSGSIRAEKELARVESRMEEIRNCAKQVATGRIYTAREKAELSALRDRQKQLKAQLGYAA